MAFLYRLVSATQDSSESDSEVDEAPPQGAEDEGVENSELHEIPWLDTISGSDGDPGCGDCLPQEYSELIAKVTVLELIVRRHSLAFLFLLIAGVLGWFA